MLHERVEVSVAVNNHEIPRLGSSLVIKHPSSTLQFMARPLRLELAGGLYHVFPEGIVARRLFVIMRTARRVCWNLQGQTTLDAI